VPDALTVTELDAAEDLPRLELSATWN